MSRLRGELKEVAPTVLSERQVRDQSPLPEFLQPPEVEEGEDSRGLTGSASGQSSSAGKVREGTAVDETWEAYFRHVQRDGRLNMWKRVRRQYYRGYYTNGAVLIEGRQGERTRVGVNHFRNILQNLEVLITSQRSQFKPRAANSDK